MDTKILGDTLTEIKTKLGELEGIRDVQGAIVEDVRDAAKTAKEAKEAADRLEASLEKLPKEWRDDLRNYLETLPNSQKLAEKPANEWLDLSKMQEDDFRKMGDQRPDQALGAPEGTAFRKSFLSPHEREELHLKAIDAVDAVPGAAGQAGMLWNKAIVGDPWVGAGAFQMPLSAPNFKTVEASGLTFDSGNAAKPAATAFDNPVGALASTDRAALTYAMRVIVSRNQEDDLTGTVAYLERMVRMAYGKQRGALTSSAVAGGVSDPGNTVKTGTANTAISDANAISKLLGLTAKGDVPDYWPNMPSFVLHPADAVTLYEAIAAKGGFSLNPQTGLVQLGAWPIHIDTQAESNVTDGKYPDFFGAWGDALIQAQLGRLVIDRYMATIPGAFAIYAQFRFLPVLVNSSAMAQIKVGA